MSLSYSDGLSFRRDGDRIQTLGVNFSGKITCKARSGSIEVWHIAPGHVWSGLGRPWNRTPTRLLLVAIGSVDVATIVKECEPGVFWKKKLVEFNDEMLKLSGAAEPGARVAFKKEG